jgi:hypothetical protein
MPEIRGLHLRQKCFDFLEQEKEQKRLRKGKGKGRQKCNEKAKNTAQLMEDYCIDSE